MISSLSLQRSRSSSLFGSISSENNVLLIVACLASCMIALSLGVVTMTLYIFQESSSFLVANAPILPLCSVMRALLNTSRSEKTTPTAFPMRHNRISFGAILARSQKSSIQSRIFFGSPEEYASASRAFSKPSLYIPRDSKAILRIVVVSNLCCSWVA